MNAKAHRLIESSIAGQPDLGRLYGHIQGQLAEVEKTLKRLTRSSNPLIDEISGYLFQKSGKRIRPALVLLCSGMTGGPREEAVLCAALVELIHTASLLHDDIIDNSSKRRGKTTVHLKWGTNVTVLLGDFLYITTLGQSLNSRLGRLTGILTDVSSRMIDGELREYRHSRNLKLSEQDYLGIIGQKTASLFSASCRIGGLLGGVSPAKEQALADYGSSLGLCFQIVDDLLDYTGTEKILGKPVLSDLAEGRITLPLIGALKQNGRTDRVRLARLFKEAASRPEARREIQRIVRSGPALAYALRRAEDLCQKAKSSLSPFPQDTHRRSLSLLADYVLQRNR